jgi:hypothetical protein
MRAVWQRAASVRDQVVAVAAAAGLSRDGRGEPMPGTSGLAGAMLRRGSSLKTEGGAGGSPLQPTTTPNPSKALVQCSRMPCPRLYVLCTLVTSTKCCNH